MTLARFEIRRATARDADGIADAHLNSIRTIGAHFYAPDLVDDWAAPISPDRYVKAMEVGEAFFVAIGPSEGHVAVLGFSTHKGAGPQHRTAVYVRGDAARSGIGSALFKRAEAEALATGASEIDVDASLAAVDFYKAHGFREIGRGEHQLWSGRRMACVFMRKHLSPPKPGV